MAIDDKLVGGLGARFHPVFTPVRCDVPVGRTRTAIIAVSALAAAAAVSVAGRLLLVRQAAIARRRIGKPLGEDALDADRVWRRRLPGEPVELLLLGDSIAAGLGAQRRKDTLGARIAKGVARLAGRPVRLTTGAVPGAETSALASQIDALDPERRVDVAVIVVGGNDVTHRVPISVSVEHLTRAIQRLRGRGIAVVVGTCPDLGALRPVPQPLRHLGSRVSRALAHAQADAALAAGALPISLRTAVGPVFISNPDEMFSLDRFHPSALGYRRTAEALIPAVLAQLGPAAR